MSDGLAPIVTMEKEKAPGYGTGYSQEVRVRIDGGDMAKREWGLRKQCAHPGCPEVARYTYATRRDLETSYEMKHEFRCTRHSRPEEVLSAENMTTEVVMVSKKSDGCGDHLYWDRNGFQHGPGFKAWADDFPEGTRLIVTARIEFPNTNYPDRAR